MALIALIGPSGVGKDALLRFARESLDATEAKVRPPIVFAHRYITRPVEAGGENHIALSPGEFALRRATGCFSLHWDSHGLSYGIGCEIDAWLDKGLRVVFNGSRAHLPQAVARYPDLTPVLVSAAPSVLRARLERRGRENTEQIEERVRQAAAVSFTHPRLRTLDNSGPLAEAGQQLVDILLEA